MRRMRRWDSVGSFETRWDSVGSLETTGCRVFRESLTEKANVTA